jgi:hypothetical protein
MKKVIRIGSKRKPKVTSQEIALTSNLKSKEELIQALVPIGLSAVAEELKHEAKQLARIKHCRQGDCLRITAEGVKMGPFTYLTRN